MSQYIYGIDQPGLLTDGTRFNVHYIPITIGLPGLVTTISVYSASAGTTHVSGIYKDSGNYPGTLLGQIADSAFAQGWNNIDLASPVIISAPGQYWIAVAYAGSTAMRFSNGTFSPQGVRVEIKTSYSSTLQATAPASMPISAVKQFAAYVTLTGYDATALGSSQAAALGAGVFRSNAISAGFCAANAVGVYRHAVKASAAGTGTATGKGGGPGVANSAGTSTAVAFRLLNKGTAAGTSTALAVGSGPIAFKAVSAGVSTATAIGRAIISALAYSAGKGKATGIGPACPGPPLPALSFSDILSAPTGAILLPSVISQTPRGAAWRTDEQNDASDLSYQHRFWRAVAEPVADLYAKTWKLTLNSTALTIQDDTGNDALDDWEHDHGLPSICLIGENLSRDRRKLLLRQHISSEPVIAHGGQSIQYFICIALELGYEITISEYIPFRCGQGRCGHAQIGSHVNEVFWRVFVTTPVIYWFRCGAGMCGRDQLGSFGRRKDLECLLNMWKPAHTQIRFHYLYTGGVAWGSAGGSSSAMALSLLSGVAASSGNATAIGWTGQLIVHSGEAHVAGTSVAAGVGKRVTGGPGV